MISFDFEAAAQLRQWDTLGSLVEETRTIADDRLYAIFADVVLCSEMPAEEATRIFEVRGLFSSSQIRCVIIPLFIHTQIDEDSKSYMPSVPRTPHSCPLYSVKDYPVISAVFSSSR